MRLTPPTKKSFYAGVTFAIFGLLAAAWGNAFLAACFFAISTVILLAAAMLTDT